MGDDKTQIDDTLVSKTYTDRDKLTIDEDDDIKMSNLNKLRGNESPEDFVKNHPDKLMAYGITADVYKNFMGIVRLKDGVLKAGKGDTKMEEAGPVVRDTGKGKYIGDEYE